MRPAAAFELRFYHAVLCAHSLDHFTAANVHTDVPVVPDCESGSVGYGVYRAGDRGVIVHLVCTDVWHTVRTVAQLQRLRIEPAVALDEPDTVGGSAADPVCLNEVRIAADSLRVLLELRREQLLGHDLTIGSPDIAPAGLPSVNGVSRKVVRILC